jgi:hypothetical protein
VCYNIETKLIIIIILIKLEMETSLTDNLYQQNFANDI